MRVEFVPKENWEGLAEHAHLAVFGKMKPASQDRVDYALLAIDESNTPVVFVTARELDAESVYWQFGGAFPGSRGSVKSWVAFNACLRWSRERYKRVSMLIENDNKPMLKMAMMADLRVVGMRNFKSSILLEHVLEFKEEG